MKKRILTMLFCLLLVCIGTVSAETDAPYLTLDRTEVTVEKERAVKLTCTLVNADPAGTQTVWTSSNKSVATVSNGTVTAKKNAGTAVITCTVTLPDGTELSAACTVEVILPVSGVRLIPGTVILMLGEEGKALACSVTPAEAKDRTVTWYSSDESVAEVDGNGFVTPVSVGKATVTAVSNADKTMKASAAVTVRQPVTAIEAVQPVKELAQGKTLRLKATVMPETAFDKKVSWSVSDRSVARVFNGVLEARAPGTVTLTCTAADGSGVQGSFEMEIYTPVKAVSLTPRTMTVFLGRPAVPLDVKVTPANAKYPAVTWRSSDESVIRVDAVGNVTPVAVGKATVTAVSVDDPTKKSTVQVKVVRPVTSITLDRQDGEIEKGGSLKVTASVSPADASDKRVIWSSSVPDAVSVSNGSVSAKKTGSAVITATAADGSGVSASFVLEVTQAVTSLKFERPKMTLSLGTARTIEPVILPADATDTQLSWSSDDPGIVSVDRETGVLTANALGSCTVTAVTTDGSEKTASVILNVEPALPVEAIRLSRTGPNGYSSLALTFRSLAKARTVSDIGFTVEYMCAGKKFKKDLLITKTSLSPGMTKKSSYWEFGYQLSYASDIRVYLTYAAYSDGTSEEFTKDNLIGWFA